MSGSNRRFFAYFGDFFGITCAYSIQEGIYTAGKSCDPKVDRGTVRFQADTLDRLNAYAEKMGLTKTEVLSKGLELQLEQENNEE